MFARIKQFCKSPRASEASLQAIITSLDDIVLKVEKDFTISECWTANEAKLFQPKEKIIGRKIKEIYPDYYITLFEDLVSKAIKLGSQQILEYKNIFTPDKAEWFRARAIPLHDGVVVSITDISLAKAQEKIIREQQAKIQATAKMSALGEMAGGIAHEINNPLMIIHGRAHQLKKMAELGELTVDEIILMTEKIEATAERISKIVKGLRTFSRNSDTDPVSMTPLQNIVEDCLELCKERFRHYGVELKIDGELNCELECRSVQIAQVLLNLLNNAFDAVFEKPTPWVKVSIEPNQNNLCLKITDSGQGIPEHVVTKMMDPFFSTKDAGKGTGLGLSISRGIMESHQGKLWYDCSSSNTCFVMELPLRQSP